MGVFNLRRQGSPDKIVSWAALMKTGARNIKNSNASFVPRGGGALIDIGRSGLRGLDGIQTVAFKPARRCSFGLTISISLEGKETRQ